MNSTTEVPMLRVRPGGVWFVAIAYGLVYFLLAVLAISVLLLWPRLQTSTRDAMRQITIVDWLEVTATLLIQAYGIVQLFRLKTTAVAALGICTAISVISVLLGAYKGQPISSSIVGLVVSVLLFWYSWELREKETLR
jgi:hypothetical protein